MRIPADRHVDTYESRRVAELEEKILTLDKAMADARLRIEKWVACHPQDRTIFKNGLPMMRIGAMELRHPDLRALESELDSLLVRWHSTLNEFAGLKARLRQG